MNLQTIFSKTGKGLQEASGKTSHLSRADRSILMAIDGKLNVAELAQRVGKPSDSKFQDLVAKLESQGFIREVAPVPTPTSSPRPPAFITPSRSSGSRPSDDGGGGAGDLDFTQAFSLPKKPSAPSKPVDLAAKAHETAAPGGAAFDYKARAEAEARAKAEAEKKAKAEAETRAKTVAEAKAKAESEARAREAEQKKAWAREIAESEAKAARDAIARAEAEEARARKEAEERKKREEEERKRKEEEARRAKEEAERRAKEEAERKKREEEERKRREEEERKARIEAERKAKEEAERKAREDAERKRREEEERKRREEEERKAREEAERKRREEEARRRKEEEERRRREEEERRAREEAERKRREEEERKRREEDERRRKEEEARRAEEERKRKDEEERRRRREEEDRRREEEDERRRREDEEFRQREEAEREAEERPLREAEERMRAEEDRRRAEEDERRRREDEAAREFEARKQREEEALRAKEEALRAKEEELARKEEEVRRALEDRMREEEVARARREAEAKKPVEEKAKSTGGFAGLFDLDFLGKKGDDAAKPEAKPNEKASGGSFADRLLADLDLFGKKDDEERKKKEEEARKAKEEAAARKQREKEEKKRKEEEARRAKEQAKAREEAERKAKAEAERRAKEEAERQAKEEAERQAREDAEREVREKEERRKREKIERRRKAAAPEKPAASSDEVVITDDDLGMDDVLRDEAKLTPQAREAAKARARDGRGREPAAAPTKFRRPIRWGRPVAMTLLVALVGGAVALHVLPVEVAPYESLASRTLGVPVKIGSARMSLVSGLEIRFENVRVGEAFRAAELRAAPEFAWLFGDSVGFRHVEIVGGMLAQSSIAKLLLGKPDEGGLRVQRVIAKSLRLEGPLPLPPVDADLQFTGAGTLRLGALAGPDKLLVKLGRLGSEISVEAKADRIPLPFLPELVLGDFSMKATGGAAGLNVSEWDGRVYDSVIRGSGRVQWGDTWNVQGEMRFVEMNAAVFAPALLSAGKAEGSGRFSLGGPDPVKLGASVRIDGKFSVSKGVLGSVDLSRAIQTGGRQVVGRTQFNELTAEGVYERGAVALRNIAIAAGALSGGGRLDIAGDGRLSGRIVAEVRTPSQQLRSVVDLSGTVKEPQASGN